MASTPICQALPWAATPRVSMSIHANPLCATRTWNSVGSQTTAASTSTPSMRRSVPMLANSSSQTAATTRSPLSASPESTRAFAAERIAVRPPFMSLVPLPYILPSLTTGSRGSISMYSMPTVSVCPFSIRTGPPPFPLRVPTALTLPGSTSSTRVSRPRPRMYSPIYSAISASPGAPGTRLGLTELIFTRSLRSSSVSEASTRLSFLPMFHTFGSRSLVLLRAYFDLP